jgi:hypothetical protein
LDGPDDGRRRTFARRLAVEHNVLRLHAQALGKAFPELFERERA